jgi:hypothetical protein
MPLALEEQATIRQLLENQRYRKWLKRVPKGSEVVCWSGRPWRVWVQRDQNGRWGFKDFEKYAPAYNFLVKQINAGAHDAALSSKVKPYPPPIAKRVKQKVMVKKQWVWLTKIIREVPRFPGMNSQHEWCPHCRRPTIFTTFAKHHALTGRVQHDPTQRRCAICGIRLLGITIYR